MNKNKKSVLIVLCFLLSNSIFGQSYFLKIISGDSISKPYDIYYLKSDNMNSKTNLDSLIIFPKNSERTYKIINDNFYYLNYFNTELDGNHNFILKINTYKIINNKFKKAEIYNLSSEQFSFLKFSDFDFKDNFLHLNIKKDKNIHLDLYINLVELTVFQLQRYLNGINCLLINN